MRAPAMTWLPAGAVVTGAAALMLAGCGATAPGTVSAHGAAPAHTRKVLVGPVTAAGTRASGYRVTRRVSGASCSAGSEAIGQAYRCFAGNGVYDPCWGVKTSSPTVLCVAEPWLRTAAELRVKAALGPIPAEGGGGAGEPWGVQLASGQRCVIAQGAHGAFHGQVIDYYCSPGLSLLRGLNLRAVPWTARSVLDRSGTLVSGPAEKIKIAWYGRAAIFR